MRLTGMTTTGLPALPPGNVARPRRRGRGGQSLTEFVVVLTMLLSVLLVLVFFLAIFTEQGWRILSLIGMENP